MQGAHMGFAKWRVQCFYDSLVQGSTFGILMNICAKNPPLRKAAKRYRQVVEKEIHIGKSLKDEVRKLYQ
jgi:hypothetical protein